MSMPMLAGVGLLVICCSSSSAAMMMGGSEETPATGAGASAGASAPTTTSFHASEIPDDAMVIDVGEIPMAYMEGDAVIGDFNTPAGSTATTRTHYLQFQSDGNLVWVKQGGGTLWSMGSKVTMPDTKIYLQGDGNICAKGNTGPHCSQQAPGGVLTYNGDVPAGQHKLVGTKEGMLYVDHGTGVAGRAVLYTPPSTTETYVLPY